MNEVHAGGAETEMDASSGAMALPQPQGGIMPDPTLHSHERNGLAAAERWQISHDEDVDAVVRPGDGATRWEQ